jgi:hypothetical protein
MKPPTSAKRKQNKIQLIARYFTIELEVVIEMLVGRASLRVEELLEVDSDGPSQPTRLGAGAARYRTQVRSMTLT